MTLMHAKTIDCKNQKSTQFQVKNTVNLAFIEKVFFKCHLNAVKSWILFNLYSPPIVIVSFGVRLIKI